MTLATAELNQEVATEISKSQVLRKPTGFVKLLGLSGVIMGLALPIGIYPRIMQSQELDLSQKKEADIPSVSVKHLSLAAQSRETVLPGSVEAIIATGIYARTNGYIHNLNADIGDHVASGQVLADIETPELDDGVKETKALVLTTIATKAQMRANLDKAKADLQTSIAALAQAKANLLERQSTEKFAAISNTRWRSLVKQGAVSSQDADEKETAYKTSQALTIAAEENIHSAESQVAAAKERVNAELANLNMSVANIDAARARQGISSTQQGFNKIVAPFSGVITERSIDRGTLITSGSEDSKLPLFKLARIDVVKVFVDVPQYASSNIKIGQQVKVNLKEFPGKTFLGKIERTSFALDANARTLKTEIHIPNPDSILAPGMYADVTFSIPRPAHIFLIPTNALLTKAEGPQVVIASGDTIQYRKVQVGDDLGKEVEIVSGLSGSEDVVMNPKDSLCDGTKVKIESPQKEIDK
jgi:RND family efflux transporter MFP subunit